MRVPSSSSILPPMSAWLSHLGGDVVVAVGASRWGAVTPEVNVDTWAATEMIIQGVEEKLHAWFQGWKGKGRMGGKRVRWINGERLGTKDYLRKRHF